jgi:membrane protease YdiL (CAAX protease family)
MAATSVGGAPGGGATSALLPPFPTREFVVPGAVLAAITVAEVVTAAFDPRTGLTLHAVLLAVLVVMGARTRDTAQRELLWTLGLAPVIRIGSLCLPLGRLPLMAWYPLIGLPIFSSAFMTARKLGYTPAQLGLTVSLADLPRQLALVPLGFILGIGEYLIFRPAPLAERFTFEHIWMPALILLVFTGFEEELIFRAIMQRAA